MVECRINTLHLSVYRSTFNKRIQETAEAFTLSPSSKFWWCYRCPLHLEPQPLCEDYHVFGRHILIYSFPNAFYEFTNATPTICAGWLEPKYAISWHLATNFDMTSCSQLMSIDFDFTAIGVIAPSAKMTRELYIFSYTVDRKMCHKFDGIQPIHASFIIPTHPLICSDPKTRYDKIIKICGSKPFSSLKSLEVTSLHKRNLVPRRNVALQGSKFIQRHGSVREWEETT